MLPTQENQFEWNRPLYTKADLSIARILFNREKLERCTVYNLSIRYIFSIFYIKIVIKY